MKKKLSSPERAETDSNELRREGNGEVVINDRILNAISEKLIMDAASTPYGRLEEFNLSALRGLTFDQALVHFPKLLDIMDDVVLKVSSTISNVLQDRTAQKDSIENCDAFALLLKKCGKWFYRNGNFNQALRAFHGALEFFPEDQEIYVMLADVYFTNEDYVEAADYYKKALIFLPEDPKILRRLAGIQIEMAESFLEEDLSTAEEFYFAALEYIPNYIPALCGLGCLAYIQNKTDDAQQYFETVLEIDPSCVQALTGLANVHMSIDDDETAEVLYEEAIMKNPFFAPALCSMAKLQHVYRSNPARASVYICRLLEIEPKNIEALMIKADIAINLEKWDEAQRILEGLLVLDPTNREVFEKYCRVKNGECFFPPQYGTRNIMKAVKPERRTISRDYYFSLCYGTEPGENLLASYSTEVVKDHEERFGRFHSRYDNFLLN